MIKHIIIITKWWRRAMSGGGQNTDPQSMDYPKMDYTNVV